MALHAPSVRAGLGAVVWAGGLHTDSGAWQLREHGRTLSLRWRRPGVGMGQQLCNESALVHMLNGVRRIAGCHAVPVRAWLRHPPRSPRFLSEFLGCAIEHGAADDGFEFPRDLLDAVPAQASAAAFDLLRGLAAQELLRLRPRPLVERVRFELMTELDAAQGRRPAASVVARRLGLSERSLRRR